MPLMCLPALRAIHLRSEQHFRQALVTAVAVAAGEDIAEALFSSSGSAGKASGSGPSAATLSRSKYRMDVLQMFLRRALLIGWHLAAKANPAIE